MINIFRIMFVSLLSYFLLPASLVQAAWVDAGMTADKLLVQLDSERYQRQGDAVTAVIKVVYSTPQRVPFSQKSYETTETTFFFECGKKQFVAANGKMLDNHGEVVYQFDAMKSPFGVPKPQTVPEVGVEALSFAEACKFKK